MTIQNFWLKQSKLIHWHKKPSFAFKKKNNNFVEWYPDGKVNIFHNCVTKNLELNLGKKIAIYFNKIEVAIIKIIIFNLKLKRHLH